MKHRLSDISRSVFSICVCLLIVGISARPTQAASPLTKITVGCRTFLVTGASYIITPTSQFSVRVTDSQGNIVYSHGSNVSPGRYGGYGAPFSAQPMASPLHVVIRLDNQTIADLSAAYPDPASCGMFNARQDFAFTDSRLNVADPWQSVAIYCYGDGTLSVLQPRYPGDLASPEVIRLTQRQLAQYPQKPAQNTLIMSNNKVQLYLLSSGELEIVAPTKEVDKPYTFIWGGC